MKVVSLPRKVNQESIRLLRDWLAQAEAGDMVDIMIIGFTPNGQIYTAASDTADAFRQAGALAYLQHRILTAKNEERNS